MSNYDWHICVISLPACNSVELDLPFKPQDNRTPLADCIFWYLILWKWKSESGSCSVTSDSLRPLGSWRASQDPLPWDSPSKNTGGSCHSLLWGIFPTQGSNPHLLCLLHWQADSLPLMTPAAASAAKVLQSYPTLCNPRDGSPPGSPIPGILQARTLEWVAISFSNAWKGKVKVKSLSRVRLFATPWSAAYQAPLSMGFSRQEYLFNHIISYRNLKI